MLGFRILVCFLFSNRERIFVGSLGNCQKVKPPGNQRYSQNCRAQICAAGLEKRSVSEEEQKSNNRPLAKLK
jgi:hypothetical protein